VIRDPFPAGSLPDRLARQLAFCLELDRVKAVTRRNTLADGSRREGDAEHMWHLAVLALALAEHADEDLDLARVMAMVVLHDVVEIDVGDAFFYDPVARAAAAERERAAAERIFGILPEDQAVELRALWEEFEEGTGPEARFARALDRLAPMLLNAAAGGAAWRENGVRATQVAGNEAAIAAGSAALASAARALVDAAVAEGVLPGPLDPG
jgi:putative hydrolase of HD superfamily